MILREIRRFIKNSPLLSSAGIIVMTLGFSASALSFTLLLAFTTLHSSGMKDVSYATLSEQVVDGGSSPISWERYTQLEKTQMPGIAFTAYSLPISAELGAYGYRKSIHLAAVSGSLFSMLEEPLLAGRYFNLNEEQSHEAHQIILTARLARELFGQPSQALEKIIVINDRPFEVIGIAPGSFQGVFGNVTDAWVPPNSVIPLMLNVPTDKSRADVWKLIPAFFALACAEHLSSHSLSQRLQRPALLKHAGDADLHVSEGLTADPQRDEKLRRWSRLGMMLAIFFTLVSSLDFCLLLLAKAPTYMEEATIKKALGAPQRRLLVELMIGPLVAMSFSLCASVLLVVGGLHQISRLSPFYEQSLRGATHALTLALASQIVFSGLLILAIALVPALYIVANDGAPRSGHTTTASRRMDVLMQIPVVLQIACCITTFILAGMLVSSLL
jgi:putative ABC transport system permease protein